MFGIPLRLILIIAAVGAIGGMVWHYKATLVENERLETELKTANATVKALKSNAKKKAEIRKRERRRNDKIDQAPASDDGAIAPVLRRTLAGEL